MYTHRRVIYAVFAALILLFSGYVLFYKLGNEPLQDYDEATYAEVTLENQARGNPSELTFLNQPYFRKPPLLFWMTAGTTHLFSDTEFALRVPSALAGLLAVLVVMGICLEAGASMPFVLLGGAVLATSATWMEFARDVRFDNLVALFIALAFYAGMRALRDPRWYMAVGIALALAVLSKSVIVAFAGVALLSYALLALGWKGACALLREKWIWAGAGLFLLIAAPWHIYETLKYGAAFWHSYLGTEVIERASTNLFPNSNNPTNAEYLGHLLGFAAPWTELFLVAIATIPFIYRKARRETPDAFYALCASVITVASVLLVMFSAGTKAFGYLMPLYPFMAVAIALTAEQVWKLLSASAYARTYVQVAGKTVFACALVLLIAFSARHTRYDALHINPYYGWEIGQAYEERDVAKLIRTVHDPLVYTYNYDAIGAILYYSRLPDSKTPYVSTWNASRTPMPNAFILATSSQALADAFPQERFTTLYSGRFVSLMTISD